MNRRRASLSDSAAFVLPRHGWRKLHEHPVLSAFLLILGLLTVIAGLAGAVRRVGEFQQLDFQVVELDDIRRDLRLGMGPCQAGFCAYRASGLAQRCLPHPPPSGGFHAFMEERWRGTRPLGWGTMLRQLELSQRFSLELLAAHRLRNQVHD